MNICSLINESLRNKDKVNKKYLNFILNEENKYKDIYLKKELMKKMMGKNIISGRESKKTLLKKENLSLKNLYTTNKNNNKILKKCQSIPDFRKIKVNNIVKNTNIINKRGGLYNNFLNKFIIKNNNTNEKNNPKENKNKYKNKINYLYFINNRNNSQTIFNTKVNINELNKTIKYFKLNKKIKNNNNVNLSLKANNHIKKEKNKNKSEHSFIEEKNIICKNGNFFLKISSQNIKDIKKKLILIRQSNEQFSMNNYRNKLFNKLCPIDNIFFNYCPTLNNNINKYNSNNSKIYKTNYSICSNQVEYNAISTLIHKIDLKEKDNKNVIININQISQISPKIKIIQNNKNSDNMCHEKEMLNKENDIKETNLTDDINKLNNTDKNKNGIKKENNKNENKENILGDKNEEKKNNIDIKKQENNNNDNKSKQVPLTIGTLESKIKNIKILDNDNLKNDINKNNNIDIKANGLDKEKEVEENKNSKIIMSYNSNEYEIKIKEENDVKDKRSKQFMRFKARLIKKVGKELQNDGDKYHISAKIIKMASKLEAQIGKPDPDNSNIQKINDIEVTNDNNDNNIIDIIEQKPKSFKKKKIKKAIFSDE